MARQKHFMSGNFRLYLLCLLTGFYVLLPVAPSFARDASFIWSPNPETVDSYRLYYADIPLGNNCPAPSEVPYNSQDAAEGPSPVETGNVTAYTLHGLAEDKTYCFALSARLGTMESGFTQPVQLPGNNVPTAAGTSLVTTENQPVSGQLSASDADDDPLVYSIVANGSLGNAEITNPATGAFTYTPNRDATGSDSFTFKVNDGTSDSNTAMVTVAVGAAKQPPVATDAAVATEMNQPVSGRLSASDPDGDSLTYSIVTNGSLGSAVVTDPGTGAFTYTPNLDAIGSDSFTFKVNDGTVDSSTATVTISISEANEPPVAIDSILATDVNQPVSGQLSASDPDGDSLAYSIVTNGSLGSAVVTDPGTGAFTYTPNLDAIGSDSFTFRVNDGTVDSNTATGHIFIGTEYITKIFGDTPDADFPGTLADTHTNVNSDINAALDILSTWSWSPAPAPHKIVNTIVIKANLSGIPSDAAVLEAKIFLYQTEATGESEYSNSIHMITGKDTRIDQVSGYNAFNGEPWTPVPENTTYNNVPLGLADTGEQEDAILLDSQAGYKSWTITGMVKEWINDPATNYGLLIRGVETPSETGRRFASSENQNAEIRPKLMIRYTSRPPAPKIIFIEEVK
ncbi:MAG: Ig-like domain-containing protein [Desulfobulbaceae bacterium]|nr:Ig-like domain-containing protein [Desulfobulbaceae bacterium]